MSSRCGEHGWAHGQSSCPSCSTPSCGNIGLYEMRVGYSGLFPAYPSNIIESENKAMICASCASRIFPEIKSVSKAEEALDRAWEKREP